MTNRDNFFAVIKGEGFHGIPYNLELCDQIINRLKEQGILDYKSHYDIPFRYEGLSQSEFPVDYTMYYKNIDVDYIGEWGDGHKYGSVEHFTHFVPCMHTFETVDEVNAFPLPDVTADYRWKGAKERVQALKDKDYIVIGNMFIDIFEPAWYLRGIEEMLTDFYINPEIATACLDRIEKPKTVVAKKLAQSGVDVIIYGDDVGTQCSMMMSPDIWREHLKPRLKRVIQAAKDENPNVLCYYHSDGDITAIIPELIECGVDILNPIQPECLNPVEIYNTYKDKVAFWGTIGTQTTMPFGTTDDVREKTLEMLNLAKESGKLILAPTHLIEPEVPLTNIEMFVKTIKEFNAGNFSLK